MRLAVTIHGDDVLAHANWEIGPEWLQTYKCVWHDMNVLLILIWPFVRFLVGEATLNHINRWRRERGDSELPASEYASAEPNLPA